MPYHRILVVEDEVLIRESNTEILVLSGYEVDAVADGAAGLAAIRAKQYDLLITDNSMPKVTGLEMVKELHAERNPVPVIMATSELPVHEYKRHPWLLTMATLIKPFSAEELLATVRRALATA